MVNPGLGDKTKNIPDDALATFLPMESISVDGRIDCSRKIPMQKAKKGFTPFLRDDVVVAKITPCFENGKGACLDRMDLEIGFGSTELIVLRSTIDRVIPKYLYYITKTSEFRKNGADVMTGSAGQKRVSPQFIANYQCGFPPIVEQEQIVRYLDSMTANINKLIRAKKKQIALLQEQRQAIINHAVTKGLAPNVEMKDSGIDWIGEIPASWMTCRCKYLFRETNNRSETGQEEHLSMSQKYGLIPDSKLDGHHLLSESYEGGKICQKDDLVLNRLKAHLGVFALAPQKGVVSPDYTILHVKTDRIEPLFAEYVLKSQKCRPELKLRVRGIVEGFWRLYTDDFYNITLPLPPLAVQKEILDAIEKKTDRINKTISLFEAEISTLKEYHDICVSSVVTGQIDVRNIPVEDVIPDDLIQEDDPPSETEDEPTTDESEE